MFDSRDLVVLGKTQSKNDIEVLQLYNSARISDTNDCSNREIQTMQACILGRKTIMGCIAAIVANHKQPLTVWFPPILSHVILRQQ